MRREVFIGVLIFASALVSNRGVVKENSLAEAAQPPQSLLIPPTLNQLRAVIFEMVDLAIPEKPVGRSYPNANKFD